jgi:hypothetical protein
MTSAREEAFEVAQWAVQAGAADALAQMFLRFAKGAGPLGALVRERQDLTTRRRAEQRLGCRATAQISGNARRRAGSS